MELTIVGCSGSTSGPRSPASCYLVRAPHEGRTFSLLLDLGPGAFGALYNHLNPAEVDAIALSHLHPDHCLDVCAFYVAAKYSATAPWRAPALYGPAGSAARMAAAYDVAQPTGVPREPGPGIANFFDYRDWRPEQQIGPFTVRTTRVDHPVEAYAVRLEEPASGGVLVFSGDTGPCPALVRLAAGADLLLVESAFLESLTNPAGLHLTGRQAAQSAQEAGAAQVVLTHIPPWHDPAVVLEEARSVPDLAVALAEPGARWTIP